MLPSICGFCEGVLNPDMYLSLHSVSLKIERCVVMRLQWGQSKYFNQQSHIVTSGFHAMLMLMHVCKRVSLFGFSGSQHREWYFAKHNTSSEENSSPGQVSKVSLLTSDWWNQCDFFQ